MGCAPHIHGELLNLSIDTGETRVGKYIVETAVAKPADLPCKSLTIMVSIDFLGAQDRFRIGYAGP